MADDSASSKGVSRGGNGAVGSGSTKTSTGSVSKSSGSSTGSGSIGSKGGGASTQRAGSGGNSGKVSQSGLGAAKSSNQSTRQSSLAGIGSGSGLNSGGVKGIANSGVIGSKGGGASTQRPGAGGNAGVVSKAGLARAEATAGMKRVQSTKNISTANNVGSSGIGSLAQQQAFNGFGPRSAFGANYLSADQMANTPTVNLGAYVKDPSRVPSAVDPSLQGIVDPYKNYKPAPISTVGANSPLADTTTDGFSPFNGGTYDPLSSFKANVAPAAAKLGASREEVAIVGALYGDRSLADVPLPTGRAFNTGSPVAPSERVRSIGMAYDPLSSVSTFRPTATAVGAPTTVSNTTTAFKTETTSPPIEGGWQAIGGARPELAGAYPAATAATNKAITDRVPGSVVSGIGGLAGVQPPGAYISGAQPYTNITDKVNLPTANVQQASVPMNIPQPSGQTTPTVGDLMARYQTPAKFQDRIAPEVPPANVPPGGIQRITNPFSTNIFSRNFPNQLQEMVTEGGQRLQASRNPMVAQQEQSTVPDYDYSNQQGPLQDLPDPAPPTKQYIGPTYPGEEDRFRGPTAVAGNGRNPFYIIPTAAPAPAPVAPAPAPVDPTAPAPGMDWFKYYGSPQPYTTMVALPEPVLMNRAPISQGAGSLLPRAVVVSPFG